VAYLLVNNTKLGRSLKTYHYEVRHTHTHAHARTHTHSSYACAGGTRERTLIKVTSSLTCSHQSGSDDEADFFSVTSHARDYSGVILEDGDSVLNPNPPPDPGPSADNKSNTGVAPLTNAELLRRSAFPLLSTPPLSLHTRTRTIPAHTRTARPHPLMHDMYTADMMWISAITFFMPGLIPYITKDKFKVRVPVCACQRDAEPVSHGRSSRMGRQTTFLNGIFLIAPPLGASISGFLPFYKISITNVALVRSPSARFIPLCVAISLSLCVCAC
jgi:hypothetical protein